MEESLEEEGGAASSFTNLFNSSSKSFNRFLYKLILFFKSAICLDFSASGNFGFSIGSSGTDISCVI